MKCMPMTCIFLFAFIANSQESLVRTRKSDDSYDSEEVEECVNLWENCLQQAPLLVEKTAKTGFLTAVGSISLEDACRELKDYLSCSRRNVATCASTYRLQRELRNFESLEVLRETACGEEWKTTEKVLPCITDQRVVSELNQCSDIHLTYSECDAPGFWSCVDFAVAEGCGSEAESFLSRVGDKLRVLDVGCPDS